MASRRECAVGIARRTTTDLCDSGVALPADTVQRKISRGVRSLDGDAIELVGLEKARVIIAKWRLCGARNSCELSRCMVTVEQKT